MLSTAALCRILALSCTTALLAACANKPSATGQVPPLDEYLRQPCELPKEIHPQPGKKADLGDMTKAAVENALLVHECEKRRAGVVKAYDKVAGEKPASH